MTWPYTMTTPYWSDFLPNSTFYRISSAFHRTSAAGVACRQGTGAPPDTWSRSFLTCICSTCWDQSFFRTCRYFSGICSSNIPGYFLDFALIFKSKKNVSFVGSICFIQLKRKRKRSDSALWQKPLQQPKCQKDKVLLDIYREYCFLDDPYLTHKCTFDFCLWWHFGR